jgi:hypothetical protein
MMQRNTAQKREREGRPRRRRKRRRRKRKRTGMHVLLSGAAILENSNIVWAVIK